jgi:hypothetical protein
MRSADETEALSMYRELLWCKTMGIVLRQTCPVPPRGNGLRYRIMDRDTPRDRHGNAASRGGDASSGRRETDPSGTFGEHRDVSWDRMSVPEAADALSITQSAVRKRIQRGTIPWDKDAEGRLYVYLDPSETGPEAGGEESRDRGLGRSRDELVNSLEDQVRFLREELERKDALLMALMQRVPELEAPTGASDAPAKPSEDSGRGDDVRPGDPGPQDPVERRSWWRKFFGF